MKLYNTLTKKTEILKPIRPPQVTMYNCGPTVYQFPHIGNWRTFLVEDFLRRSLDYLGYQTRQVMNITDVGHLVSDADIGDDKIEIEAEKEKKSAQEIADFYLQAFLEDSRFLNIKSPQVMPRASEHIADMIQLVQKLEERGYTYQTSDGVYFNTAKFKKYGRLSGQKSSEKKAGARIKLSKEKINPNDFILWKFSPKDKKRQQEWPSPWGVGAPGWHIECSALSRKYLGQPFDIHTGGVDHIGVHHENEIAQSEAAYNKPQANIWLHVEFLQLKQEKMSKSKGGFITIKDLIQKGYDPLAYRIFVLSAHYQSKQNFTWATMDQAQKNLDRIYQVAKRLNSLKLSTDKKINIDLSSYRRNFKKHLRDNLDTPQIISLLLAFVAEINRLIDKKQIGALAAQRCLDLLIEWDQVIGVDIENVILKKNIIPGEIQKMIKEREKLREERKWDKADLIRKKIEKMGYQLEDTARGTEITSI